MINLPLSCCTVVPLTTSSKDRKPGLQKIIVDFKLLRHDAENDRICVFTGVS